MFLIARQNFPSPERCSPSGHDFCNPLAILFQFFSLYHQDGQIFRGGNSPPPVLRLCLGSIFCLNKRYRLQIKQFHELIAQLYWQHILQMPWMSISNISFLQITNLLCMYENIVQPNYQQEEGMYIEQISSIFGLSAMHFKLAWENSS